MTVKLKADDLAKGRKSLYLDVYIDQNTMYRKGLQMYLDNPTTPETRRKNKEIKKLAEAVRNQYELDLLNKKYGNVNPQEKFNYSFLEYFDVIVKQRYETGVNYYTWDSVQKHLNKFTKGTLSFEDVTESWMESFKSYLTKKGLAQNTCHTYFNKVKKAIHTAHREGIIDKNPAYNVTSPKMINTKREFLTEAELLRLKDVECRYPILKKAFFFSVLTGLRWSDVQNLKWKDIREVEGQNYLVFTQQKTKQSERLPINNEARGLMGERRADKERVFVGLKYSAWHNVGLSQWVMRTGITKHITFHCARHTNATLLLNKGVDIFTVSKMLGHSEVRTTQIYAKLASKAKVEAVEKLPSLF